MVDTCHYRRQYYSNHLIQSTHSSLRIFSFVVCIVCLFSSCHICSYLQKLEEAITFVPFIAIMCDWLVALARTVCLMSGDGTGNNKKCSVGVLVIFIIGGIAYLVLSGVHSCMTICSASCEQRSRGKKEKLKLFFILVYMFAEMVAGLCYYIGDNLYVIMRDHVPLGCTDICVERCRVASFIFLFIATMLYLITQSKHIYKSFTESSAHEDIQGTPSTNCRIKCFNGCGCCFGCCCNCCRDRRPGWCDWYECCKNLWPIILLPAYVPKVDTLYTAVEHGVGFYYNSCEELTPPYSRVSWVFFAVTFVIIIIATILAMIRYKCIESMKKDNSTLCQLVVLFFITIMACSYLLADNRLPLNCTSNKVDAIHWARVGLFLLASIIFIFPVFPVLFTNLLRLYTKNARATASARAMATARAQARAWSWPMASKGQVQVQGQGHPHDQQQVQPVQTDFD